MAVTKTKVVVHPRRRVIATLLRGRAKELVIKRHYAYFDTAMPRMLQICISLANEGDVVEFYSDEYGFQIGTLKIKSGGRFEMDMNPIVRSSPSLLKLMTESDDPLHKGLIAKAMLKPLPEHRHHTKH